MTFSDAFAAEEVVAAAPKPRMRGVNAGVGPRARARDTSVHSVTNRLKVVWADLVSAWWLPATIPPLTRAWADRFPDRSRVPADNELLYRGWVVYNHTVGLAVPAVALLVVAVLTPAVWVFRHPARLLLAAAVGAVVLLLTLI